MLILVLAACGFEKELDPEDVVKDVKTGQTSLDNYTFDMTFYSSFDNEFKEEVERSGQVSEADNIARTLQVQENGTIDNSYYNQEVYFSLPEEWVPLGNTYESIGDETFAHQFFTNLIIDLQDLLEFKKVDGDVHFSVENNEEALEIYEQYIPIQFDGDGDSSISIDGILDGKTHYLMEVQIDIDMEVDGKSFKLGHEISYSDFNETSVDIPDELKE